MSARAYIGVGGNIDAERNVRAAIRELAHATHIFGVSTFYATAPIGHPNDPWFVNGVIAIDTDSPSAASTRDLLRHIESDLGRHRGADRDAPRTIDLDLLLFEGEPPVDPKIRERAFVAWPLAELAPRLEVAGQPIRTIAEALPRDDMIPLPELTAALRQEAQHG